MGFNTEDEQAPEGGNPLEEALKGMLGAKMTPQMVAMVNDERIYQCAFYHLTKGHTAVVKDESELQKLLSVTDYEKFLESQED